MSPFAKKIPFLTSPMHGAYVLLLFYSVGIIGLISSYSNTFRLLTPFNLLLSAFILIAFHNKYDWKFWGLLLVCFTTGFGVEWLGIHTALIFGHYSYGETLGFKYEDVPIIIGLNWYLLAYISTDLSARTKFPLFVKVILGALFMTAIDYLIEPIAIRFGFWFWHSGQIPLSNYVGWFLVSLPLQWFAHRFYSGNNPVALWLLLAMTFFFLTLHFI